MPPLNFERFYYLDRLRAVLMMLGVVLHSAQVFNPSGNWLIVSPHSNTFFLYLNEFIHLFRMPAFFFISGFFCALTLTKYHSKRFLQIRLPRILVPLAVTALTLNSLQAWVLTSSGWQTFTLTTYLAKGQWVSHLWFLINLVFYFLVTFLLHQFGLKNFVIHQLKISNKTIQPVILLCLALPIASIAILALNKIGVPLYGKYLGFIDIYSLLRYYPYFFFGYIIFFQKHLLQHLLKRTFLMLIAFAFLPWLAVNVTNNTVSLLSTLFIEYSIALQTWALTFICLGIFEKFGNKPSKLWLSLSESAYTVYIFHHVLVVTFGLFLIQHIANPAVGFVVLSLSVFLTTLIIHWGVIRRAPLLLLLFNGRHSKRAQ